MTTAIVLFSIFGDYALAAVQALSADLREWGNPAVFRITGTPLQTEQIVRAPFQHPDIKPGAYEFIVRPKPFAAKGISQGEPARSGWRRAFRFAVRLWVKN